MNRIELSSQSVETVPLHASVPGMPAGAAHVPLLVRTAPADAAAPVPGLGGAAPARSTSPACCSRSSLALRWPHEPVPLSEGWPLLLFPPLVMFLLLVRGMYERRLRPTILDGVDADRRLDLGRGDGRRRRRGLRRRRADRPRRHRAPVGLRDARRRRRPRRRCCSSQRRARHAGLDGRPTLIVGAGAVGTRLARRLARAARVRPAAGRLPRRRPARTTTTCPACPSSARPTISTGSPRSPAPSTSSSPSPPSPTSACVDLVRRCEALGLEVSLVPRLFESLNDRATLRAARRHAARRPAHACTPRAGSSRVKYAFDRVGAALLILLFAPADGRHRAGRPRQLARPDHLPPAPRRPRRPRSSTCYKFRSMRMPGADARASRPATGSAPGGVEGADRRTRSGACCAAPRSTSCRSSSTCCAAR